MTDFDELSVDGWQLVVIGLKLDFKTYGSGATLPMK